MEIELETTIYWGISCFFGGLLIGKIIWEQKSTIQEVELNMLKGKEIETLKSQKNEAV